MSISARILAAAFFLLILSLPAAGRAGDSAAHPYVLTHPSVGLLQITAPAALHVAGEKAYIQPADATVITGMEILLYDDNHQALPFKAQVASIEKDRAMLSWPDGETIPQGAGARLITYTNVMAKRLPRSALKAHALWKVDAESNGTFRARRIEIADSPAANDDYFDAGDAVRSDDYVIVNPDDALQSGMPLPSVTLVGSNAPTLDPQAQARLIASEKATEQMISDLRYSGGNIKGATPYPYPAGSADASCALSKPLEPVSAIP